MRNGAKGRCERRSTSRSSSRPGNASPHRRIATTAKHRRRFAAAPHCRRRSATSLLDCRTAPYCCSITTPSQHRRLISAATSPPHPRMAAAPLHCRAASPPLRRRTATSPLHRRCTAAAFALHRTSAASRCRCCRTAVTLLQHCRGNAASLNALTSAVLPCHAAPPRRTPPHCRCTAAWLQHRRSLPHQCRSAAVPQQRRSLAIASPLLQRRRIAAPQQHRRRTICIRDS